MITLKAALIAASAVGTVAVGGGATWAMAGASDPAAPQPASAKAPAAERQVQDKVPATPPTCLPAKPGLPGAKLPNGKLPDAAAKKEIEKHLKQNPAGKDLPQGQLPKPGVPAVPGAPKPGVPAVPGAPNPGVPGNVPNPGVPGNLPKADLPKTDVPGVKAPDAKTLPKNLPSCAPSTGDLGKNLPAPGPENGRVPGKPGLPSAPKLDCSKLSPAVKVGSPVEKAVMLTKGLRYASAVPGTAELRKHNICAVTQKWTGAAGQWITVETLKTPAGMSQNQLRQALNLPQGGTPITVYGTAGWMGPGGSGVLLFDPNGYSMFVNGSPVLSGGLKDVTAALRQAQ
ncbi:hypothetical protein ETD83_06735 [Actinomadura soli]|uniref:Uncharacterized protein n=1 Tax=Actinomadura soli TaxID=2508997 RepID=A0A5C4JGN7_9ACTN|nr:hypothetical protein [Actinomadura soli]TMR05393.1 hypothetical protein ETD83_06735 [Actinomadura soli]